MDRLHSEIKSVNQTLSWLNDLMQGLGRFVPRVVVVAPTHRGVRFGPRGSSMLYQPGLAFYWPIIHEFVLVPWTTQSIQFCARSLSVDGVESDRWIPRVAFVGLAMQYRVHDAILAATRTLNIHALADNRALAAVGRAWMNAAPEARLDPNTWLPSARDEVISDLDVFGVIVDRLDVTSIGIGIAVKIIGDWNYSDRDDGKRPQ